MRVSGAIFLTFLGLVAPSSQLSAQDIQVQSGDHPGFTRMTLSIPTSAKWTLSPTAAGYDLQLDDIEQEFDVTSAFDPIARDRITDLRTGPGLLQISLGCDCHIETFPWQDAYLVLDIKPGADPARAAEPEPALSNPTLSALPIILPTGNLETQGFTMPASPAQAQLERSLDETTQAAARTSAIEWDLAESIARAASQGLLEPVSDASVPQMAPAASMTGADPELDLQATDPDIPAPDLGTDTPMALADIPTVGINFQTSIDRERPAVQSAPGLLTDEPGCLPEHLFDMAEWADDRSFAEQIAEKRSALTSELDRIPSGAAEDLARTYISFGFGREAMQALAIDHTNSQERRVLASMAAAIDDEPQPFPEFSTQEHCPTAAALWAMLVQDPQDFRAELDRNAVLRAFTQLAAPLRPLFGPKLAEKFLAIRDTDAADAVLNRLVPPSPDAETENSEHAAAAIAGRLSGPEAEIAALTVLARENARVSPDALIDLFTLARSEAVPVPEDLIELSAALRFENRKSPDLADLVMAEARLLIDFARIDQALELIADETDRIGAQIATDLTSEAIVALVVKGSDVAFLGLVLGNPPDNLSPDAQNAVAARLIALGFPDPATALLIGPSSGSAASERRYLRAEAALANGDADSALRILGGLTDIRAATLKAAALALKGDEAAAYRIANSIIGTVPEPEAAWRAGLWSEVAQSNDAVLKSAGSAMLATSAPQAAGPADQQPSLADGTAALEGSKSTRDMIGALLQRFPAPEN